jgi:hypothetical protein
MNPKIPIKKFIKKFDTIIIDADYSDASGIISICNDLDLKYFVFQIYLTNIQNILEKIKPKQIIILLEFDSVYLQAALDIISGVKQAKGRLPYSLTLPASYIYY